MGLAGLTAVFGMGTGVAPPVWSPEKQPDGGEAVWSRGLELGRTRGHQPFGGRWRTSRFCVKDPWIAWSPAGWPFVPFLVRHGKGSAPIGVVKLLGC
jgi:hypothetical protein